MVVPQLQINPIPYEAVHRRTDLKCEITSILHSAPIVDNLARKTVLSLFVLSLIQLRKVQFNELATGRAASGDLTLAASPTSIRLAEKVTR